MPRSGARSASIRTRRRARGSTRPRRWCSARRTRRSSASARPGSISITTTARAKPQRVNFRAHIAAARATGLPLIVHAREADEEIAQVLREEAGKGGLTGVMHCFSSGRALAEAALELGFYISLSGIVTFKNAEELREIARDVPLDRLLVETDAPYLAPMPLRGKRNEPAFVAHTARFVAELKGVDEAELAHITTDNFFRLFRQGKAAGTRTVKVTILGCGPSAGVPLIGGNWGTLQPGQSAEPPHAAFGPGRNVRHVAS